MSLLRDRSFLAASLAHFSVDFLNALRPLLVAVLSAPLGLTNSLVGLVTMLYTFAGSVTQPVFGWLADRFGARRLAFWGILWMVAFFALAFTAGGMASLVFLVVASLGSGAFHPAGAVEVTEVGRLRIGRSQATAASAFILFGQVGYSISPALSGLLIGQGDTTRLLLVLPLTIAGAVAIARNFSIPTPANGSFPISSPLTSPARVGAVSVVALASLTALRSWAQTNMVTFLPKFYSDLGFSPAYFGLVAALFMGGSAFGGVAGGWLGDRAGNRSVILWSLVLGAIPLALFAPLATTPWALLLSAASGALTGAANGITVVLFQRMMPGRLGAASGIALGYSFASGAVGTWLSGFHADLAGFDAVFLTTAGITLLAGLLALGLREPAE